MRKENEPEEKYNIELKKHEWGLLSQILRGSRQMDMQARPHGSLLRENKQLLFDSFKYLRKGVLI